MKEFEPKVGIWIREKYKDQDFYIWSRVEDTRIWQSDLQILRHTWTGNASMPEAGSDRMVDVWSYPEQMLSKRDKTTKIVTDELDIAMISLSLL